MRRQLGITNNFIQEYHTTSYFEKKDCTLAPHLLRDAGNCCDCRRNTSYPLEFIIAIKHVQELIA